MLWNQYLVRILILVPSSHLRQALPGSSFLPLFLPSMLWDQYLVYIFRPFHALCLLSLTRPLQYLQYLVQLTQNRAASGSFKLQIEGFPVLQPPLCEVFHSLSFVSQFIMSGDIPPCRHTPSYCSQWLYIFTFTTLPLPLPQHLINKWIYFIIHYSYCI
jgi:hypothetical protein